jgi:hypothetical protein
MNVLAAVIPQITAYVVGGSETGDVSRDDVNRDRFSYKRDVKMGGLS